jgi:hyperosmotically inducible periplasmic protein
MKAIYSISLIVAAAALFMLSMPVQASQMDDRIVAAARQSYVFKTFLQDDDIKIESRDGVVTLTGVVADNLNKALVQETVAGLPGVISVDNRLEIKGAPPSANSDAWVRAKVQRTLFFHRSVSAGTTAVDVKDGIVTLRGNAASEAQKELTTEYTKDVEGVKGVNNEMIVTPTAPNAVTSVGTDIDDASITAQVKLSLLYHRSTSAMNTKVETSNGDVTLYGKANNAAEVTLATKLALDVTGVKGVKNRMTFD